MDLGQSQPICSLVSQDPAGWVGVSRGRGWRRKGKSRKGRAHQRGAFHGPIPMRFRKRASRCSFLARSPLDQKRKKRRLESSFSYALMLPSFPPFALFSPHLVASCKISPNRPFGPVLELPEWSRIAWGIERSKRVGWSCGLLPAGLCLNPIQSGSGPCILTSSHAASIPSCSNPILVYPFGL